MSLKQTLNDKAIELWNPTKQLTVQSKLPLAYFLSESGSLCLIETSNEEIIEKAGGHVGGAFPHGLTKVNLTTGETETLVAYAKIVRMMPCPCGCNLVCIFSEFDGLPELHKHLTWCDMPAFEKFSWEGPEVSVSFRRIESQP